MTPPSLAYRDGWLAQSRGYYFTNPYHEIAQQRSHKEWYQGWTDRAVKLPGDPYLEILDQEMMGS